MLEIKVRSLLNITSPESELVYWHSISTSTNNKLTIIIIFSDFFYLKKNLGFVFKIF